MPRSFRKRHGHRTPTAASPASLGPRFRRLWMASVTSNLADGVVLVGAPLVAIQFTRAPELVAGLQVAMTLPWLLLALHAGVLADRRDRRRLMVSASLLRAAALVAIGAATWLGLLSLPVLYLALLVFGAGEVLFDTASQSILPDLVSREQLGSANGELLGAQLVAQRFAGGPIAGVTVGISLAAVFAGPGLLYLAAALVLVWLPGSYRPTVRPPATARADIAEAIRFLRGHAALRTLAVLGCVLSLGYMAYFSVFVLFVVGEGSPMGLPEAAYGVLMAVVAAGSVGGSLLAGRLERALGPRRLVLGALASIALLMLVPVLSAAVVPVAAMTLAIGFLGATVNVTIVTVRQRVIPGGLLGRVNSAYRLLAYAGLSVGALLGGAVAGAFGLRVLFAAVVALQLVALAVLQRPVRDADLGAVGAAGGRPPI